MNGDIVEWAGFKMEIFWGEDIGIGYGFCWRPCGDNSNYHESMTGFIDEYEVIRQHIRKSRVSRGGIELEEDIKILEKYLKDCENKFLNGSEVFGTELYKPLQNILTRYKQLEQENRNFKEATIINDRIFEAERNKNKELEKDLTSVYISGVYDERSKWELKVKEKIKETANKVKELEPCKHISPHDYGYACGKNEGLRELLGDEK